MKMKKILFQKYFLLLSSTSFLMYIMQITSYNCNNTKPNGEKIREKTKVYKMSWIISIGYKVLRIPVSPPYHQISSILFNNLHFGKIFYPPLYLIEHRIYNYKLTSNNFTTMLPTMEKRITIDLATINFMLNYPLFGVAEPDENGW